MSEGSSEDEECLPHRFRRFMQQISKHVPVVDKRTHLDFEDN